MPVSFFRNCDTSSAKWTWCCIAGCHHSRSSRGRISSKYHGQWFVCLLHLLTGTANVSRPGTPGTSKIPHITSTSSTCIDSLDVLVRDLFWNPHCVTVSRITSTRIPVPLPLPLKLSPVPLWVVWFGDAVDWVLLMNQSHLVLSLLTIRAGKRSAFRQCFSRHEITVAGQDFNELFLCSCKRPWEWSWPGPEPLQSTCPIAGQSVLEKIKQRSGTWCLMLDTRHNMQTTHVCCPWHTWPNQFDD